MMNGDAQVYADSARHMLARARQAKRQGDALNTRGYVQLARHWNRRARCSTSSTPITHEEVMAKEAAKENGTKPQPVQLRTARDHTLVVQALESRHEELTKLEKKNTEEGYLREARTIAADAIAIKEMILPEFKGQQEIPFVTSDNLASGVAEGLRHFVHAVLVKDIRPQGDALKTQEEFILEELSKRVSGFACEIATKAYSAGYAARAYEPEAIALSAVSALAPGYEQ